SRERPAWKSGVLEAVTAGQVDGKAPLVGRTSVAQPTEADGGSVANLAIDVGEVRPESDADPREIGPVLPGVAMETGGQRPPSRLRDVHVARAYRQGERPRQSQPRKRANPSTYFRGG